VSCHGATTARIQVGHEREQSVVFSCQHCSTDIRLTLILDEPPIVKIRWDENYEEGTEEGAIINIGAGFTVPKDKLHQDKYFPSFDAPRPTDSGIHIPAGRSGGPILYKVTSDCSKSPSEACEVTRFTAIFEVRKNGRTQIVQAAGESGC
jgi:hypothetical protein